MSGGILEFIMHDLGITVDECVHRMYIRHQEKDEAGFQKAYDDYELYSQKYRIGERMVGANLECWDWKWAAETGNLCRLDWERFRDEIREAGVNTEEFDEKWG